MQKVATENVVCIACGADVRSEAMFCYNCGGAVASLNAKNDTTAGGEPELAQTEKPIAEVQPPVVEDALPSADEAVRPRTGKERKPLTADRLRKKRASNRQPIEVTWEEPTGNSSLFIVVTVVLTIFAALILVAALYLK